MAQRSFLRPLAVIALVAAVAYGAACRSAPPAPSGEVLRVYVGTYTDRKSRGIYLFEIDAASGHLVSGPSLAGASENPAFLAFHPSGRFLYAVNVVAGFRGGDTGAVSAFAVDPSSGRLTLLNQQPSNGAGPCHLAVDGTGRHLVVANYDSGTAAVMPVGEDGRIEPSSFVSRYAGSGPNKARQAGPHAHQVLMDPAGRYLLCADLGADRIHVERFDRESGRLEPNEPDGVALEPGSGPRHLAWHPNGRVLYAICEMGSTLTASRWDADRGVLSPFQTVSTLPEGFTGRNLAAEIAVAPDGRFVYASNRGHDSIAVFAADASGKLSPVGRVPTRGRTPRSFAIDRTGRWLIAANQSSGSIAIFGIDPGTGLPRAVGRTIAVPAPVCILFAPPHRTGQ